MKNLTNSDMDSIIKRKKSQGGQNDEGTAERSGFRVGAGWCSVAGYHVGKCHG
jgi:hypothetical protein